MSDLEQTAIERLRAASDMSLRLFEKPLVITYSGGKDSDVLLHLARVSDIPFEALHSLTTADAFKRLQDDLYAQGLITIEGLKRLNELIDECAHGNEGGTEHG